MLGEPVDTLFLSDFDKRWAKAYELEKGYLKKILGNFTYVVEHIGSTTMSGLRSRPIVDLALGVGNKHDQVAIRDLLNKYTYTYCEDLSNLDVFTFKRDIEGKTIFTVRIFVFGSDTWNFTIKMRNYLIDNIIAREKYSSAKADFLNGAGNDKAKYCELKKKYINREIASHIM